MDLDGNVLANSPANLDNSTNINRLTFLSLYEFVALHLLISQLIKKD